MSPVVTSLVVACLATLAGAGVVAGFLRRVPVPLEPLADPLEDRRQALLRSLADLEEARASGVLEDAEYSRLREDTDARMARLLRALDRRAATAPDPVTEPKTRAVATEPRRVPTWAVVALVGGTVVAMVVSALLRDTSSQTEASSVPSAQTEDAFAFFEDRVRQDPDDLAARLDLAHRYLDAGRVEEALDEYTVVLDRNPDDAEALAHVGLILYLSDRPNEALSSVDRSLQTDPDYPEALFFRGVILLRGLDRPEGSIQAFERYLDAAPFGTERGTVRDLIAEARAALAGT